MIFDFVPSFQLIHRGLQGTLRGRRPGQPAGDYQAKFHGAQEQHHEPGGEVGAGSGSGDRGEREEELDHP